MFALAPRVWLPSKAALNPNLSVLIDLCEGLLEQHGPAAAAAVCGSLSVQLRQAADHPAIAGMVVGPLGIDADAFEAAADWFADASKSLGRCQQ